MKHYLPTSVRQLVLVGFAMVALPLLAGLVTATVAVDRLAAQSQRTVFEAAYATRFSQTLLEQITAMERNARQYQVLKDRSLYDVYLKRRQEFQQTAADLGRLNLHAGLRDDLDRLVAQEASLFDRLHAVEPESDEAEAIVADFPTLTTMARSILAQSGQTIAQEADHMQDASARVQRLLILQASALIPAAFGLALIATVLVTRPVRQIDDAIRRLGAGEFGAAIRINGPRDLVDVGRRLDWLRLRLMELEQEKVRFLRHVSHELKTPLTVIREGAELLRDEVVGRLNAEQTEVAEILRDNSVQLQRLIENLLNFSISQASVPFLDRRPVRLGAVIEAALAEQKLAVRAKQLEVHLELAEATAVVDSEKLRVIVDNLLSNAIKYSPPGGTIRIGLQRVGTEAVLEVRDEGPGVAEDERERIFEAFYQGRARHQGHVDGSGLGLSIAQEYARMLGGAIEALSSDRGAHLRVCLPLVGAEA